MSDDSIAAEFLAHIAVNDLATCVSKLEANNRTQKKKAQRANKKLREWKASLAEKDAALVQRNERIKQLEAQLAHSRYCHETEQDWRVAAQHELEEARSEIDRHHRLIVEMRRYLTNAAEVLDALAAGNPLMTRSRTADGIRRFLHREVG